MLRVYSVLAACILLCGCYGVDYGRLAGAGANLVKAGSLSEDDVKTLSMQMRAQEDAKANVAPESSPYVQRLNRLMANEKTVNGIPLTYKVYMTPQVNANAAPDGSVRVYSGLMDKMNDDELRFVLGHEIGHVAEGHSLNQMRMAYATEAARLAGGALHPTAAALTNSQIGALAKTFLESQYSQSQESAADKYSMDFLKRNNYNTKAAGTALRKLADGGSSGVYASLFSTHPDPLKRAQVMDEMAAGGNGTNDSK